MLLSYFMREHAVQLTGKQAKVGWCISLSTLCVLAVLKFIATSVFELSEGLIWTLFNCWMIFAFQRSKSAKSLRNFLSHRLWLPLSRLGLGIYLTHKTFMFMTLANMKQPTYFDVPLQIHVTFADFIMSMIFAVILYLVIEAPVLSIAKHFETAEAVKLSNSTSQTLTAQT